MASRARTKGIEVVTQRRNPETRRRDDKADPDHTTPIGAPLRHTNRLRGRPGGRLGLGRDLDDEFLFRRRVYKRTDTSLKPLTPEFGPQFGDRTVRRHIYTHGGGGPTAPAPGAL